MTPIEWGLAVLANFIVASVALRRHAVTESGAIAGFLLGTVIFLAGAAYWLVLMLFFVSSTLLGRISPARRRHLETIHAKGSRRDAWQVVANIGPASIAAVAIAAGSGAIATRAFAAAMAAATADTWSSEIGVLSRSAPISVRTLKPACPGVSGAVSGLGLIAGAAGALLTAIAAVAAIAVHTSAHNNLLLTGLLAFALGLLGTILDSVLGASVQASYVRADGRPTEKAVAEDGRPNTLARGVRRINNDGVNFLTTATTAAIAVLVTLL